MVIGHPSIYELEARILSRLSAFFPLPLVRLHGLSLREDVSPANGENSVPIPAAILGVDCSTCLVLIRGASLATIQWDSR